MVRQKHNTLNTSCDKIMAMKVQKKKQRRRSSDRDEEKEHQRSEEKARKKKKRKETNEAHQAGLIDGL